MNQIVATSLTWFAVSSALLGSLFAEGSRLAVADDSLFAGGVLQWSELPSLPSSQQGKLGVSGAFAGTHNGVVLLAGGFSVENGALSPKEAQSTLWRDDIFVLHLANNGNHEWIVHNQPQLPHPLGNGSTVSTDRGVVCIGGSDGERCYAEVLLLKWISNTKSVRVESLPSLPRPLTLTAAAALGDMIYVAGGQETPGRGTATKHFWALDISPADESNPCTWQELPTWPGPERSKPVLVAQHDGFHRSLYLFSGQILSPDGSTNFLTDGYVFRPATSSWETLGPITLPDAGPRCLAGTIGTVPDSAHHMLVFGGAPDTNGRGDVLAYHTITDTWTNIGALPESGHTGAATVSWNGTQLLMGGEIQSNTITPRVWAARPMRKHRFGWLNGSILLLYLLGLIAMGIYFAQRGKTTEDYFKAGRRIPWWASGLSIFGTQLSAITFMAIPAKAFATDWRYLIINMAIPIVAPLVIFFFLPFYRRLNLTTAYEYLERRFNLATRMFASAMFMVYHLGRIGIVLFLPSIALSLVTGIDVSVCIVSMGLLCIFYTVAGGIEAVIWTDVIQVVILLGGALVCLVLIPFHIPAGWNGMCDIAVAHDKLHLLDFRFSTLEAVFWIALLGGLGESIIAYGTDQSVIQRYLTTKDESSAARGIWTNALLIIPVSFLFFGIGTALFAFYKTNPQAMNPTLENADAIFPWFIVTQLPVGLAGLIIAAVFSASMSSLDSSMHSISTAVTTDFYHRFRPNAGDRGRLVLARWATAMVGILGTSIALFMARWDIQSLLDQALTFIGLFAGGLGGLFLLAIFTRKTHGTGALIGLLASGILQLLLRQYYPVHASFYPATGIFFCLVIGYTASLIIPQKQQSIEGLTIYTLRQSENG